MRGVTGSPLSLIDEHLSATEGQMRVALQLSRARALYETNRKDEAMSIVKELMPQTPPIPPILSLGMQLLVDDHRFSEAQALMEQWNQLHGEAIDVTTQMAGILYRSQQSEGILMAEQLLREQLEPLSRTCRCPGSHGRDFISHRRLPGSRGALFNRF